MGCCSTSDVAANKSACSVRFKVKFIQLSSKFKVINYFDEAQKFFVRVAEQRHLAVEPQPMIDLKIPIRLID